MCGIGGILRTDGQPIPEEWLDAIDARIAYRGPDGSGRFRDRVEIADASAPGGKRIVEVAFVHRRLSIIDHKDGAQPMVSERGRNDSEGLVAVVFNGCIYNHRELRRELEANGHRFVTDHSDTEVLIHGWREWGNQIIDHLEGMFGFAVWDRSTTTLFLARDAFGEKPLYFAWKQDGLLACSFASDGTAVESAAKGLANVNSGVSPAWLNSYLQLGYGHEHSTPFNSALKIENLTPGGFLEWECNGRARGRSGWGYAGHNEATSADRIEAMLECAVHRRLEADVPLGCFLSGGVDSSLVAYFARRHKPDLKTYSVRMPDPRYDESGFAESVALHLGARHHTLSVSADPASDLVTLVRTLGQPFGDSSILPTYWVSKSVRDHAKVALSGDGGDELFIGYERYLAARMLHRFHSILGLLPASVFLKAHPKSRLHKIGRLVLMSRDYRRVGLLATESIFNMREIDDFMGTSLREHPSCFPDGDAMATLRSEDISGYLPGDLLTKVDTASMACGLEVRCPFLDRDLARAALAAPIEQLMPGGQRKGLLRQIARKYLPKEIVDRPKMGFAIPIGEWFRDDNLPARGAGMKTLLLDHLNSVEPFGPIQLNRRAVQRFIDEHMSGKRDHGQRLFTLLTLSIWARMFART